MRIYFLLVLAISISIATAKKESSKSSSPSLATNKTLKSSKTPGENRGKRTLTNLGYPGFSYNLDFANRRQGYSDARAFYSPDGAYSGQSAIGQYSIPDTSNHLPDFNQFSQYSQYLEAPEPIIEIIIKDSNETVPTHHQPQPIVQKKKKEKVHVYYVKYKKDENNKLHLDEPIASLSENEAPADETEEIIHYPSIVTPLPPVKTTTLRTVIHPDSEKFHSNSGIQVTFGSEDKSQSGHELQEHNAESIQRSVITLPQASGFPSGPHPTANVRADFNTPRATGSDSYQGSFYQNQNQNSQREYKPAITHQQLPEAQALTAFRPQLPLQHQSQPQHQNQQQQQQPPQIHQNFQNFQQNHNQQQPFEQQKQQPQQQHQQHQQQQQHQSQQQQQRPFYNQGPVNQQNQYPKQQYQRPPLTTPAPTAPPVYQNYQQHNSYQQQQQPQQYYQFSQQPKQHPVPPAHPPQPQPQQQHQQQYQQQHHQQSHHQQQQQQQQFQQRPLSQAPKQNVFFPTPPPKTQDLPSRQSLSSYQPVKFRPTPVPSTPKLEITNRPPVAQAQKYNRLPSFVQQPNYSTLPQPQGPQYETINRYQKLQATKIPSHRPEQSYNHQQLPFNHKQQQSQTNSFGQSQQPSLSNLHNLFDARPSKETELLKAIPKFEQHITETVNGNHYTNYQTYSSGNQVIHDIPAPNLGPTTPTASHAGVSGHYNGGGASTHQQFNNFVTSSNPIQYQSSTQAPQYVKTNDGQQIQIVTPMPSTNFYNQQGQAQSQFISSGSGSQPQVIPNSQPKPQASFYNQQQPRQSESSQFSVSTLHSDVFKELENRKNNNNNNNNINFQPKQNFKNYVTQQEARNSPSTTTTTPAAPSTTSKNAAQNSLQLPDEVPDDLRQQLLSSGILDNADISILDYDKVGDVALENLPAEHLQHFYGAGGGAQISESNKVLTVVKPNGDSVDFSEKNINKVKESKSLPHRQNVDLKVVHFSPNNERNITNKHIKTDSTVVPPIDLADKQYNRYLPLKINGAQFPIPDVEELQGKKIASVVVLAPVDNLQALENERSVDERIERDTSDSKEVKFASGDIIKQLIKKPTKDNFKKWLEKESRTDVDSQSVVLLVAKTPANEQEIFMYDIATRAVNKLNGELSSAFVNVAEENASAENLDHASTLDPSILENMMEKMKNV